MSPQDYRSWAPRLGRFCNRYLAALVMVAAVGPGLAAAATVAIFLSARPQPSALWYGSGVGIAIWLLVALVCSHFATAARANPRVYDKLGYRWHQLDARLAVARQALDTHAGDCVGAAEREAALREAERYRDLTARDLGITSCGNSSPVGPMSDPAYTEGLRWLMGSGYVAVWHALHSAEEALIAVEPLDSLVGAAVYDELRLRGATIAESDNLRAKLKRATTMLNPSAARFFGEPSYVDGEGVPAEAPRPERNPEDEPLARAMLREVRLTINEFRDDRRDALVRARNRLMKTIAITGLTTCLLLGLTVLVPVSQTTLVAASGFFLVGAVVGLFRLLYDESNSQAPAEDFGMSTAYLLYKPLASGLAAFLGVVLTVALATFLPPALGGQAPSDETAPLAAIFDLGENPAGLVIAAIFGLTPQLLFQRLRDQTDRLQGDLKGTEGPERTRREQT
jgi:hypothetical protein